MSDTLTWFVIILAADLAAKGISALLERISLSLPKRKPQAKRKAQLAQVIPIKRAD